MKHTEYMGGHINKHSLRYIALSYMLRFCIWVNRAGANVYIYIQIYISSGRVNGKMSLNVIICFDFIVRAGRFLGGGRVNHGWRGGGWFQSGVNCIYVISLLLKSREQISE